MLSISYIICWNRGAFGKTSTSIAVEEFFKAVLTNILSKSSDVDEAQRNSYEVFVIIRNWNLDIKNSVNQFVNSYETVSISRMVIDVGIHSTYRSVLAITRRLILIDTAI